MTDTEKLLFKLTPQEKASFSYLYKWANEEMNIYGEVIAINCRSLTCQASGITR